MRDSQKMNAEDAEDSWRPPRDLSDLRVLLSYPGLGRGLHAAAGRAVDGGRRGRAHRREERGRMVEVEHVLERAGEEVAIGEVRPVPIDIVEVVVIVGMRA